MKQFVWIATIFFTLVLPTLALADSPIGWQGYLFLAPGTGAIGRFVNGRANIHVGGGGEALVYKGLGVGGEIGAVTPWSSPGGGFICCLSQTTIGLTSTNFSYHVLPGSADRRLEPFVTAVTASSSVVLTLRLQRRGWIERLGEQKCRYARRGSGGEVLL